MEKKVYTKEDFVRWGSEGGQKFAKKFKLYSPEKQAEYANRMNHARSVREKKKETTPLQ